ncbi:MAG TPA: trigger factor [Methylomirabilota bacterium]|nr:trigger factor [Methylomirabilota bacterium]
MKVEIQELDSCKRQLLVEAPEAEVTAAWTAACDRIQRDARLPGFRRGKVPRTLVRSRFADEVRRAVAETLVPEVYRRALDETRLDPVEEPDLRDLRLEEGQPLRFTAVVEVKPAIVLDRYRGVTARHTPGAVSDADVEAALTSLAERRATLATVNRPARSGDFVTADYELAPEGQPPRREEGYTFEVGAGRVLPDMDEAALGLAAGDERRLTVRFPDDHPRVELKGATGQLTLRVTEVKEKEVPPLDDEFARGLGSHETLADLRAAVRTELQASMARQNRLTLEQALVDAVLATHAFAVPESLVLREVTHRIGHARERVRRQGVDPDRLPWDYARLTAELRPDAERAVRRALLLEAIAEREEIAVDEAEVDAEIERLARDAGRAPQAMRSLLERGGDLAGLRLALREQKTLDFLIQHADVQPAESAPGTVTR